MRYNIYLRSAYWPKIEKRKAQKLGLLPLGALPAIVFFSNIVCFDILGLPKHALHLVWIVHRSYQINLFS